MHPRVSLVIDDRQTLTLDAGEAGRTPEAARAWLDAQFVALECEPLRASGKVLIADKVLAVAQAAGPERWGDAHWAAEFAAATTAALGKPLVTVDLRTSTLAY
ncbi:MAG: hypothetical protein Fur0019_14000 [Tibeticola sp.]